MHDTLILFLFICLCLTHANENEKAKAKAALKTFPILVKINIMEEQAKEELANVRKMELTDVFQTWVGSFDYTYARQKIVGTVQLKCHTTFSVAENTSWMSTESSNANILAHLAKYRITEIPSWDSKITCKITVNNSHDMSHVFIPEDILTERHSHNIKWEKKLI